MTKDVYQPRAKLLHDAEAMICGSREGQYGPPQASFDRIARLWSTILGAKVNPHEVALCMAALKIARLCEDPHQYDSWTDIAGYAALGQEVTESS